MLLHSRVDNLIEVKTMVTIEIHHVIDLVEVLLLCYLQFRKRGNRHLKTRKHMMLKPLVFASLDAYYLRFDIMK